MVEARLGAGTHGTVLAARVARADGQGAHLAAVKHVHSAFSSNAHALAFAREVIISAALSGTAAPAMLGACARQESPCIAYERMECDLCAALCRGEPLDARDIAFQLLAALCDLHALGAMHRDIKPANVLLTRVRDGFVVRLCDLGSACLHSSPQHTLGICATTRWYRAPELLIGFGLGSRSALSDALSTSAGDLWAVGCVIVEAVANLPLLPGENPAHQLLMLAAYARATGQLSDLRAEIDATTTADAPRAAVLNAILEISGDHTHPTAVAAAAHVCSVRSRLAAYSLNAVQLCDALLRVRPAARASALHSLSTAELFVPLWSGADTSAGVRCILARRGRGGDAPIPHRQSAANVLCALEGLPCFAAERITERPAVPEAMLAATAAVEYAQTLLCAAAPCAG